MKTKQNKAWKIKKKPPTRSGEGGIEAVEVLPLPFGAVVFNDLLCAELIGSMRRSEHTGDSRGKVDEAAMIVFCCCLFKQVQSSYRNTVPSSASFTRLPSSKSTTSPLKLDTQEKQWQAIFSWSITMKVDGWMENTI